MTRKLIILGTAHLGTTPGKRSPDGKFREAVYSREIAQDLKAILEAYGQEAVIDYEPLEPNKQMQAADTQTQQTLELRWRTDFVNSLCAKRGAQNCLYISMHVNAAGMGSKWMSARGWSIYTSPGKTESDTLATHIWNAAKRNFPQDHKNAIRSDWKDGDPDYEAKYYVLMKTKCPAVLTENLFQDNKEDVEYLTSMLGYQAVTRTHLEGILTYLQSLNGKV